MTHPGEPDVRFWFDPVCPFAWITSQWVRTVQAQRDYEVEWRFISLRLLNAHIDYDAHFPPDYEAGHTSGLRMLRLCAAVRAAGGAAGGNEAIAALYPALSSRVFGLDPEVSHAGETDRIVAAALAECGLDAGLVAALDDTSYDALIQAETDEALSLVGKDVGTPILHIAPPEGAAFFGPVISRLPSDEQAGELWDHVVGLATFPGFAELKRSLREKPQLPSFGIGDGDVGVQEDWHAGSRRQKR